MIVNSIMEFRGKKRRVSSSSGKEYYIINLEDENGESMPFYMPSATETEVDVSNLIRGASYLVFIELTDYNGNLRTGIYDIKPVPFDKEAGEIKEG